METTLNRGNQFTIVTSNGKSVTYECENKLYETESTLEVVANNYKSIYYKYNVIALVIEEKKDA